MMNNKSKLMLALTTSSFLVAGGFAKAQDEAVASQPKNQTAYECKIIKYVSMDSDEQNQAIEPFLVEKNGPADAIPGPAHVTGEKDEALSWKVTRYSGLISVEVADADGKVLSISTTADGSPIGLKVPSTRNILSCNPPEGVAALEANPTQYGRTIKKLDINPRAYGESMRRLDLNPRSYGSTMTIQQVRPQFKVEEVLKKYLESLSGAEREAFLRRLATM